MSLPPVVGLEIGTTKIVALVGELREDGVIMITGIGERPSSGVRKGEITDLENAAVAVRSALKIAEETSKVTIRAIHLAVSGGHLQGVVNRGTVPVMDEEAEIGEEDVDQVMEVARAVNLPPDREVLHTISQQYCIDNQERVVKPIGMEGGKLSLDMLVLHGVRSRLNNAVRVARSVPVDVHDVAFSGLCSALAVLTATQKKSGAVVIDLGGGTTDFVVYADGVVAAAGALGVGGDHITNDITLAFNIPSSQAEKLKRESGSAWPDPNGSTKKVSLPAEMGFPGRLVSLNALHTVIHARVEEALQMVKRRIEREGFLHHVGAGVILTGGGAHLAGVPRLVEEVFGLPCHIGCPLNISGLATATEGPEYAAPSGLVQYGFKTAADEADALPLPRWLKGLFGR